MSAPDVLARPALRGGWRAIPRVALWLAAGLLVLGILFHQEIAAAIAVWMSSTAYNHCFLILPITAYLLWDRREVLRGIPAKPAPIVALAGIPVALVWLTAERLGIMEGRQLAAMTFVELLFLAVLGWRLSWALAGPLLYLYFLVPFGDFITPALQDFTTDFVRVGLNLLQIPVYIDGYTIEIPQGAFYIAEACAGLRFLIASVAFGALYALVMYRTPLRRSLFMLASLVVPIIANGLRALGIVVLGNVLGSAKAAATDHVLYGWLFFSIVILILIALGLPFRQDQQDDRPVRREDPQAKWSTQQASRNGVFAAAAVCLVAMLSPAVALALEPRIGPRPGPIGLLDFGPSCHQLPAATDAPLQAPGGATRRLDCGGLVVVVRMNMLSPHVTAAPLFGLERQMIARMQSEDGFRTSWVPEPPGQPRSWRLLQDMGLSKVMAVATWSNGTPTQPGLSERLRLGWTSIIGASSDPIVMTATPEVDFSKLSMAERRAMLQRFVAVLQNWPNMTGEVRRFAQHG